ncbi:acylphosphatase [Patescibacteria group bacterium]
MDKQVILKIYGRVQMVLYRDSTRRRAKKLGLTGLVNNKSDGTVEVIAEGPEEKLKELIKWCYNGPILARVDKIEIQWREATGNFNNFEIKY